MTNHPSFDHIANSYDDGFTHTPIGIFQRKRVYHLLQEVLNESKSQSILELNAGTGEDALWLAEKGYRVTATDIAPEMISLAMSKASKSKMELDFDVLDIRDLPAWRKGEKYDLIFSNFGGFNCLRPEEIRKLAPYLADRLCHRGKMALVMMPPFCLWETAYFLLKLSPRKALRRRTKSSVQATLESGHEIPIWYHHPDVISAIVSPYFSKVCLAPVGISIPPSYLNPFFRDRPGLLQLLYKMEEYLVRFSSLSRLADHYFILFEKRME